jgi:hypothetical protein
LNEHPAVRREIKIKVNAFRNCLIYRKDILLFKITGTYNRILMIHVKPDVDHVNARAQFLFHFMFSSIALSAIQASNNITSGPTTGVREPSLRKMKIPNAAIEILPFRQDDW